MALMHPTIRPPDPHPPEGFTGRMPMRELVQGGLLCIMDRKGHTAMIEEKRSGLLLGVEPLLGCAASRTASPSADDDSDDSSDDSDRYDDNQPDDNGKKKP